ncbi:hypothetical protein BD310DRAFT_939736 [Dichomitus squalens]|uniref:Secreted protein n=1 Tax=Dichomitus squalens TaxID=114155 RepID=A0A4Q9PGW9_9APHY|nr:hypothetical protein BD310DRAFT_939736 [Dichomitus squalens]
MPALDVLAVILSITLQISSLPSLSATCSVVRLVAVECLLGYRPDNLRKAASICEFCDSPFADVVMRFSVSPSLLAY